MSDAHAHHNPPTSEDASGGRAQLRLIADALPLLVAHLGSDLRHRFVNRAYALWFGKVRESVEGRTLLDIFGESAFQQLKPHVERTLRGENSDFEAVIQHHDGSERSVRCSYAAQKTAAGEVDSFVASMTDISAEKALDVQHRALLSYEQTTREHLALLARVGETLAESLDYETTLLAVPKLAVPALGDFCFFDLVDADGGLQRLGHAHADPAREALLSDPSWSELVARDQSFGALASKRPALHATIDEAWLTRVASSPDHLSLLRALSFQSLITVPLTYRGRSLGALTLFFKVGGRRHSASELALAEELARRASAAIENARLFQEARDAVGIRDDFLSIAGHELRTPLTALQLQVLSIERMLKSENHADKIRSRAEKAARNVVRLSTLVNELLDISRISAGRLTLQRTEFDLSEPVFEVLARMAEELVRAGCTMDIKVDSELRGSWDRLRIEQIVTNLISNASKYGQGKPIELRLARSGPHACLTVRDFGVGISLEDQKRIFERFERAVPSRHSWGLGLGLWIARQLVEAHGGTIRVTSAAQEGATFEVELALTHSEGHP